MGLLGNIVFIIILYVFWAFFAGTETAFVSVNRFKLQNLRKKGRPAHKTAFFLIQKPERILSTTLVGTNICLVLSANIISRTYLQLFGRTRPLLALATATLLSFILCEVMPKTYALRKSLFWTTVTAFPLFFFYIFFFPVSMVFSFLSVLIIRLMGLSHSRNVRSLIKGKEDVRHFLNTHLGSRFSVEESRYFLDTLDFGRKILHEVMVPLIELHALTEKDLIKDCYDFVQQVEKEYIPIYRNRIDNIIGVVYIRDLLYEDRSHNLSGVMKDPVFVPETKNIGELYRECYERNIPLVFAVDEHGGVTGAATVYDIGEEVVGKIAIEEQKPISRVGDREYLCSGDTEIDELNGALGTNIEGERYTTVNGLILHELGRIPRTGDSFIVDGYRFTVEKGSARRSELVRVKYKGQKKDAHL